MSAVCLVKPPNNNHNPGEPFGILTNLIPVYQATRDPEVRWQGPASCLFQATTDSGTACPMWLRRF